MGSKNELLIDSDRIRHYSNEEQIKNSTKLYNNFPSISKRNV